MTKQMTQNRVAVIGEGKRPRWRVFHERDTSMMAYCGRLYDTTLRRDDAIGKLNLRPCVTCQRARARKRRDGRQH